MQKITKLLVFIDKFKYKSRFSENITKDKPYLDHIWRNVLGNLE